MARAGRLEGGRGPMERRRSAGLLAAAFAAAAASAVAVLLLVAGCGSGGCGGSATAFSGPAADAARGRQQLLARRRLRSSLDSSGRWQSQPPRSAAAAAQGAAEGAATTAVLIAPAQFGVRADYESLIAELRATIDVQHIEVVDLLRTDWLRIIPATVTNLPAYLAGELPPTPTLNFYYERLDEAVERLRNKLGPGVRLRIIGHSIGGWVARGWLAERRELLGQVDVLMTLGSPNRPPPEGSIWAGVDQTRGLLREINRRFNEIEAELKPRLVSVVGRGTVGGLFAPSSADAGGLREVWDESVGRSPLLEGVVAATSYLALCGDAFATGDGLIPVSVAAMDGSEVVELPDCNHAGFVPSPTDSLILPETYKWYGSKDMVPLWAPKLLDSKTMAS